MQQSYKSSRIPAGTILMLVSFCLRKSHQWCGQLGTHAIPFHAELLFKKFGFGLGINSMQGREAKHVKIAQFSKHATLTTRWTSVLKHDYVTLVWLRKQDPSTVDCHKCKEIYEPKKTNAYGFCCCGLQQKQNQVAINVIFVLLIYLVPLKEQHHQES